MPTPLTDAIEALTTYANTVTGASDTTLSDAVATLASGYGGGGISIDDIATNAQPNGAITLSDSVTTIASYAFTGKPITAVRGDGVTVISNNAFQNCTSLTSLNFPVLWDLWGNNSFSGCTALTSVHLSNVTRIGSGFNIGTANNPAIAVFPKLTQTNQSFRSSHIKTLDLGVYASIGNYFVTSDAQLDTLILRKSDAICTLTNLNGFAGSAFASNGTGGTLYVPSSLVTQYQQAANWSTILGYANNSIQAIEGSQYENYYADGTPIE